MDKFSELRAFIQVIENGGFSAAARAMGQSRSSVNRLVIALEARLGVQLLNRTTRSVSATSAGRAMYERARQILDDLDEMERAVSSARTEAVGKLRLSVPLSFGDLDFGALVASFMMQHRAVEVEMTSEARLVDPVAEGYDAVIRIAQPDEQTTLVDHRILRLEYLLVAGPSYLAARGAPQDVSDLAEHAVLHQPQGVADSSWLLEGPNGAIKQPVSPVLVANNLETLLTAACAGLGVAAMPEYAVRSDIATGRLARVLPDFAPPPRMLQVIYPPARHLSAKVRLFAEFVADWCGDGVNRHSAVTPDRHA